MNLDSAKSIFLDHCKSIKQLSPHTIRAYCSDLKEFSIFIKNKRKQVSDIRDLKKEDIKTYMKYLFENRMLKERTIKRKVACLKVFFRWLEMEEQISSSPFYKLDTKIKLPKCLPRNIPSNELRLLFQSCDPLIANTGNHRNVLTGTSNNMKTLIAQLTAQLSIEILFATGVRVSELASITLNSINISDRSIHINGKGKRERRVFIPDQELLNLIECYLKTRNLYLPSTNVLLINSRGRAASTQYIRKLIRYVGENAGISNRITPHRFRHSCATQLLEAGVDIRFVQKLLGHESISTTEIYTQVCDSALKETIATAATKNKILRASNDN